MLNYYLIREKSQPYTKLIRSKEYAPLKPNQSRVILSDGMFETLAECFINMGWHVVNIVENEGRNQQVKPLIRYLYGSNPTVKFSDFNAFGVFGKVTFKKGIDTATLTIGGRLLLSDPTLLSNELAFMYALKLPEYLIT